LPGPSMTFLGAGGALPLFRGVGGWRAIFPWLAGTCWRSRSSYGTERPRWSMSPSLLPPQPGNPLVHSPLGRVFQDIGHCGVFFNRLSLFVRRVSFEDRKRLLQMLRFPTLFAYRALLKHTVCSCLFLSFVLVGEPQWQPERSVLFLTISIRWLAYIILVLPATPYYVMPDRGMSKGLEYPAITPSGRPACCVFSR